MAEKNDVSNMGTPHDMEIQARVRVDDRARKKKILKACRAIFKNGASINGVRVKRLLPDELLVPTIISICYRYLSGHRVLALRYHFQNSFSERISGVSETFNFFLMFVVDLLHEFEHGVWKAIFMHLMRILYAVGGTSLKELNYW